MAEDGPRREQAEVARELDRRLAVAADHLLELVHALRTMHGERQVVLLRGGEAVAQQFGRAGVDLRRIHDAGEATARVPHGLLDQPQRGIEAAPAGNFVPAVFELPAIVHVPACRRIAGCQEHAQPALRREIEPAFVVAGQVGDGGDAGQQHFAIRHLLAGLAGGEVGPEGDRAFIETAHGHGGDAVILAHAAIERLGVRMRMDVDQPGHHHQLAPVDRRVRMSGVVPANERHRIARERQIAIHQVGMPAIRAVPRNDDRGVADAGDMRHGAAPGTTRGECDKDETSCPRFAWTRAVAGPAREPAARRAACRAKKFCLAFKFRDGMGSGAKAAIAVPHAGGPRLALSRRVGARTRMMVPDRGSRSSRTRAAAAPGRHGRA